MKLKKCIALMICSAMFIGIMDSHKEISSVASENIEDTVKSDIKTTAAITVDKEVIEEENNIFSEIVEEKDIRKPMLKASPGQGAFETGTLSYKYQDKVSAAGKYSSSTQIQISWQGWWAITDSTGKWSGIYFTSKKPSAPESEYDADHGLQNFILDSKYNVLELPVSGDIPHNSGGKKSIYFKVSSIPSNAKYLVLRGSGNDIHCYIKYDGPTSADVDSTAPTVTYSAPSGYTNSKTNTVWYADKVDVTVTAQDSESKVDKIFARPSYDSSFTTYDKNAKTATQSVSLKSTGYVRAYAEDILENTSIANSSDTYNVDTVAPTITGINNAIGGKFTATISDNQSGLHSYAITTSTTIPSSGWVACNGVTSSNISYTALAGGTYYVHVKDIVGHVKTSSAITVSAIIPTATHTIVGTKVGNWYKGTTNVTITGSHPSGVDINRINAKVNGVNKSHPGKMFPITLVEGKNTLVYNATDNNNITSANGNTTIYVDATEPTDVEMTGVNEWSNSGISVTLKAKDKYSGVAKLEILKKNKVGSFENYKTITVSPVVNDATKTALITDNGTYKIKAYDLVGYEVESNDTFTVDKLDTTNPEIESTIVAEKNSEGKDFTFDDIEDGSIKWYKETTEIQLDATDMKSADGNTSGLDKITYGTTDVTANGEVYDKYFTYNLTTSNALTSGLNTITATATDKASNVSESVTETIYIDGEGPENYVTTKETEDWVSVDDGLKISFSAEDMRSGIQLLEVLYSKDKTSWDEVVATVKYDDKTAEKAAKTVSSDTTVYKNGYYKLRGTDALGHVTEQSDDAALHVTNIETGDEVTLSIEPDTKEWVNASTGVELTAGANNDATSGITRVDVYAKDENRDFQIISSGDTLESAVAEAEHKYQTLENGVFKTGAVTGTGKEIQMDDSEAYEVTNIDGIAPEIATSSDNKWVREEDGYNITAVVTDSQSGIGSVKLQKYNEETYSYEDVNVTATEAKYVNGEENMMEAPEKGNIVNTVNAVKKAFLEPFSEETVTVSEKQGSLAKKVIFNVKENGKYRVVTNDIVENMNMSDEIVVSTIASQGLSVWTEGNPTEWTNQSATIKVYATDTNCDIEEIKVDGNTVDLNNTGDTYYTSFVVDENSSHTITVTDEAGYSKTTTVDVTKIDKVKPVISTNAKSVSYNQKGLGTVKVTISDNASGIKAVEINGTSFDITNTEKQTIKFTVKKGTKVKVKATDVATNVENGSDDTPVDEEGSDGVVDEDDGNDNTGGDNNDDSEEVEDDNTTKTKKKVIKRKSKILPVVTENEDEPEPKKKEVKVTKIKEDEPQPKQPVKKGLPTGAKIVIATTASGALFIFLFFLFTNVTIYAADTEGKYRLIGRTRAKRKKDFYEVKTPKVSVNKALTGNFKYVFSKSFCKTHRDWEINIIIDSKEFTRYLREDDDSIYIQYTKTLK